MGLAGGDHLTAGSCSPGMQLRRGDLDEDLHAMVLGVGHGSELQAFDERVSRRWRSVDMRISSESASFEITPLRLASRPATSARRSPPHPRAGLRYVRGMTAIDTDGRRRPTSQTRTVRYPWRSGRRSTSSRTSCEAVPEPRRRRRRTHDHRRIPREGPARGRRDRGSHCRWGADPQSAVSTGQHPVHRAERLGVYRVASRRDLDSTPGRHRRLDTR